MVVLLTFLPLRVSSAGVGIIPGPSHWISGVLLTPLSRLLIEQVRLTEAPTNIGEEGEEIIDTLPKSKIIFKWQDIITWGAEVCCCR